MGGEVQRSQHYRVMLLSDCLNETEEEALLCLLWPRTQAWFRLPGRRSELKFIETVLQRERPSPIHGRELATRRCRSLA